VELGIRGLRDLDLQPRVWITPGYPLSLQAHQAVASYFSHALQQRAQTSWLPYPTGPDQFGQVILPVGPSTERRSASEQLQAAALVRIVRDGWASVSYDPDRQPLDELEALVAGLRADGYAFADLRALPLNVRSTYQPGPYLRAANWWSVDLRLLQVAADRGLTRELGWWPAFRQLPWSSLLVLVAGGIFLARLREQWRPVRVAARSLVESTRRARPGRQVSATLRRTCLGLGTAGLVAVGWACGSSHLTVTPLDGVRRWSGLDWSVQFDGFGQVGDENGDLSLVPRAAILPDETHAALLLAGDPNAGDLTFSVRMSTRAQLRQNALPNPWETGWIFFHYQAPDRSYYLAHKTNGLELGRLASPAGQGQVYLATLPSPRAELGRWYDYKVDMIGATIRVYIDGRLELTYIDPDPIPNGQVGLYSEDAQVTFRDAKVILRSPGA
jgi:hypothetical protein